MSDILVTKDGDIFDILETGLDYLASIVVDNILNTVLTDLYAPDFGTELKHMPRYNIESKTEFMMKLTLIVEQIEKRLLAEQIITPSTSDEMLSSIKILDIKEDSNQYGFWYLVLKVTSLAGESTTVSSPLFSSEKNN